MLLILYIKKIFYKKYLFRDCQEFGKIFKGGYSTVE
jgi:hypothetical protein